LLARLLDPLDLAAGVLFHGLAGALLDGDQAVLLGADVRLELRLESGPLELEAELPLLQLDALGGEPDQPFDAGRILGLAGGLEASGLGAQLVAVRFRRA